MAEPIHADKLQYVHIRLNEDAGGKMGPMFTSARERMERNYPSLINMSEGEFQSLAEEVEGESL